MKQRNPSQTPQRTPIDWSEVRRRLERSRTDLERFSTPSADEQKATLKSRAKVLAEERKEENALQTGLQVLEFLVAYEKYGIDSAYVREVYPLRTLTPLPGTPSFVLGVINVRGRIVSVIDPKRFFDLPQDGLTDLNKVILISNGSMEFGLLADAILGLRTIQESSLQRSLSTLTGFRTEWLKGVTSDHLAVLDAARLLSGKSLFPHQERKSI